MAGMEQGSGSRGAAGASATGANAAGTDAAGANAAGTDRAAANAAPAKRVRTCIACRRRAGKHELCRVVRTPQGGVELDLSGKMPGRGAYTCYDGGCFTKACERRLFAGRLKCKIDKAQLERLESSFAAACARRGARQVGMV